MAETWDELRKRASSSTGLASFRQPATKPSLTDDEPTQADQMELRALLGPDKFAQALDSMEPSRVFEAEALDAEQEKADEARRQMEDDLEYERSQDAVEMYDDEGNFEF